MQISKSAINNADILQFVSSIFRSFYLSHVILLAHQKLVIFVIVLRSAESRTNSEKMLKREKS